MALHCIAVGNAAEAGCSSVARIRGAENAFKVHEPARREIRAANAERKRRLLGLLLRSRRRSYCGCCVRASRGQRARRLRGRSRALDDSEPLFERLDFLMFALERRSLPLELLGLSTQQVFELLQFG